MNSNGNPKNNLKTIDVDEFEQVKTISYGDMFAIYEVIEKETNKKFTAKVSTVAEDAKLKVFHDILTEFSILTKFNSPFILKWYGYSLKDFENDSNPTVITEFCENGSLKNLLENRVSNSNEFNDTKKLMLIYGIASGMAHVHSKNVIHRDLKPSNIFLNEYLLPKISNFYAAKSFDSKSGELKCHTNKGSPFYMAPEIINSKEYDKSVDVYSFSLIVHEILTGKRPKYDLNKRLKGEIPEIDSNIQQCYRNLIIKCMSFEPEKRPSFEEIVYRLKTDKSFITNSINEKQFYDFIKSVEKQSAFKFEKVHIEYNEVNELTIEINPINLNLYEIIDKIGSGSFGNVYKIKKIKSNDIYAAKINKLSIELCDKSSLSQEVNILSKLNSPLVLKFIGYSENNFQNKPKLTIITEFAENQSLDRIIELVERGLAPSEWNSTKLLTIVYGIASGMSYLHSKNILHRDLKPGNIFLDKHLFPKIGDFGLSIELKDKKFIEESEYKGTPAFMSPEILNNFIYNKASDVYSFAILLYQMITLQFPFKNMNYYKLIASVVKGDRPKFDDSVPNCYKKLIESCWSHDANKRPTFEKVVEILENDEFITEDVDREEYFEYIDYIKNNKSDKKFPQIDIDFEKLKKIHEKNQSLNAPIIDLNEFEKLQFVKRIDNFKIFEVKNKKTNEIFEAKISTIEIANLSEQDNVHLSREISILSKLNHPSILEFIGYSPIDFNKLFKPVIITEKPQNKSLNQLLNMERAQHINEWDETKKLICIYGIASGMSFLHSNEIIHRNLNPDSIFFDDYLFPKIGNFGLLTKIHSLESMTTQTSIGIKGNFVYSSPELLKNNEYSKSNDVYAFSLIVYEIMTLETPFLKFHNFNMIYKEVVERNKRPKFNVNIENCYKKLIEKCWSENPKDRPTFDDIKYALINPESGFITKNINEEIYYNYVYSIENSKKEFDYSNNYKIKFDAFLKKSDFTNLQKETKKINDTSDAIDNQINRIIKEKQKIQEDDISNDIDESKSNCNYELKEEQQNATNKNKPTKCCLII